MDEYIKRSTVMYYLEGIATADEMAMNIAKAVVKRIPAADVVKVVRCKDCKHFRDYTDRHGVVMKNCIRDWHIPQVEPEHFCSYGERRDNDATG